MGFSNQTRRFPPSEKVVEMARFRISSALLAITLIASDIAIARVALKSRSQIPLLLAVVGLPMANILAIGFLIAPLKHHSHFIRGFERFGSLGLAFSIIAVFWAEGLVQLYLSPAMALDQAAFGAPPRFGQVSYRLLAGFCLLSLWATWPQLSFAVLGGFMTRRLRLIGNTSGPYRVG